MSDAQPRQPRYRTLPEKVGSIVLAFEAIVVFLAGLSIFGLKALPDGVPQWWGIVAGAVMAVLMILTSGLLRYRWGLALGWVLQVITALGAFFVPAILFVTLVFGGMWVYATIGGARIERRISAQRAAAAAETD